MCIHVDIQLSFKNIDEIIRFLSEQSRGSFNDSICITVFIDILHTDAHIVLLLCIGKHHTWTLIFPLYKYSHVVFHIYHYGQLKFTKIVFLLDFVFEFSYVNEVNLSSLIHLQKSFVEILLWS